jgi:hypothetical protein
MWLDCNQQRQLGDDHLAPPLRQWEVKLFGVRQQHQGGSHRNYAVGRKDLHCEAEAALIN